MTILTPSRLVKIRRQRLWSVATAFDRLAQWLKGVAKVEFLRGDNTGVGSVWRVHYGEAPALQVLDFEITEWLAGHRFGLRPVRQTGVYRGVQLFQLVLDFKEVSDQETVIAVLCEYEPLTKLGRVRNLTFLRRHYLGLLEQLIDALSRTAEGETRIAS